MNEEQREAIEFVLKAARDRADDLDMNNHEADQREAAAIRKGIEMLKAFFADELA